MCQQISKIQQKEIYKRLSSGQMFHGFIAPRAAKAYELSEKGYRIDAATRADFTRQAYDADDALRADNMTFQARCYWIILEHTT